MQTESQNQLKQLITDIGVSESQFLAHTGLSVNELINEGSGIDGHRIKAVQTIFLMLEAWFESPQQAWQWYTEKRIFGFGDFTPAQVVIQHQVSGASLIIDYINSKNLECFE
jgi:hypothetical protein